MRQPDMSHSTAYYQDQSQVVAAYLSNPAYLPTDSPTARFAAESSPRQSTIINHDGTVDFTPSELNPVHTSTTRSHHPADPWDSSHYSNHHSRQQQYTPSQHHRASVEQIHPDIEQPEIAVAPVTFVSSPYLEDGSILTWTSYSSGAVRKEERVRGSWTDHSSYMSGDNHSPGAPRVHKRAIQDDDLPTDDSQDALMLLFRMSIPIPMFSLFASLYTIFGLLFAVFVSPLRLFSCVPYLRKTSFCAQICDLLVPQLHIHQRLIGLRQSPFRSASTQSIYNNPDITSVTDQSKDYSVGGLILVLLLSSLMSFGLLLLAWTAAFFWVFAMILGNPDGTEGKDDGRAAVLGVTRWWQMWLGKARKPPR